jgi:hypothetical protein
MTPQKIIFTGPPPAPKELWRRTVLAMSIVLAATLSVTLLWRAEHWPGSAAVRAVVLGFGIAFGARYGAHGRIRGQVAVQLVIGAISATLFYALNVRSAQ